MKQEGTTDTTLHKEDVGAAKRRPSRITSAKVEEAIRESTLRRHAPKLGKRKAGGKEGVGAQKPPLLSIEQILVWADAWHERTGDWPTPKSGAIPETLDENWSKVHSALRKGNRGLPGPSTLTRLLAAERGVRNIMDLPKLSIPEILAWADAWRELHDHWPTVHSGSIGEGSEETWGRIDSALCKGGRGLAGGSTLARLLAAERGLRNNTTISRLTIPEILQWAERHKARTGRWPVAMSGTVLEAPDENWKAINAALHLGLRGLPGGSSLARLLGKPPWTRNERSKTHITEEEILEWADAHHQSTGKWPTRYSGAVADMPGEFWSRLDQILFSGNRGLPGGSSLVRLLEQHRGVPNPLNPPALPEEQILCWADAWYERYGKWPSVTSGQIPEKPELTWKTVDNSLARGSRGLAGGSSLATLLAEERGHTNRKTLPKLTEREILQWAERHHQATGGWPNSSSGLVTGTCDEYWSRINNALKDGMRGLPGGSSLAQLLAQYWDRATPKLTEEQILMWADSWHERTGKWPQSVSGPIPEAAGTTWRAVDTALGKGVRGLPGGSSLPKLLAKQRSVRYRLHPPTLTEEKILAWADTHFARTGTWPTFQSGPIPDEDGETWSTVDTALRNGTRGLPTRSSLMQLLVQAHGIDRLGRAGGLTEDRIRDWAETHRQHTGHWPTTRTNCEVPESHGDTWISLDKALRYGRRGLSGGSSLAKLKEIQ